MENRECYILFISKKRISASDLYSFKLPFTILLFPIYNLLLCDTETILHHDEAG